MPGALEAGIGGGITLDGVLAKSSNEDSIEIGLEVIELDASDMVPGMPLVFTMRGGPPPKPALELG